MFSASAKIENGFDKIVLCDEQSKTRVEVVPACGAVLHSFSIVYNGNDLNIIDNYSSAGDFKNNVAGQGFKSCKLSPFACRIQNAAYDFAGVTYQIEKYRDKGHALHGLLFDAVFTIVSQQADEEKSSVTLLYKYPGWDKGYPFKYDCIITYTLSKDNSLNIETEIINKDEGLIPVQDGWHPYFSFGGSIDELQLEFQSKEEVEFNDALIPTGKLLKYEAFSSLKQITDTIFDNCYTLNFYECQPLCVLRDAVKNIQLEIHTGDSYPYLNIYTPSHRKSIAIENLSAVPNAFNNGMGLVTLAPGSSVVFKTMYKITSLNHFA